MKIDITIDFNNLTDQKTNHELLEKVIQKIARRSNKTISLTVDNKFLDFQEQVNKVKKTDPRSIAFEIYDFDIKRAGIIKNPLLKDQIYCKFMTPDYTKADNSTNFETRYAQYISLLNGTSEARTNKNLWIFKDIFPKILGIYILIGRLEYYERFLGNNYGFKFIAANGIPTQHELTPRSSNQSFYFVPITFILNIDAKLNEGKTHLIDDTLQRKCVKFFREAFESTLNRLTKEFVRTVPHGNGLPETDLIDQSPIDIKGIDIKREPVDENTLIALFYQLLKLKGLSLPTYGLLGQGVFDGKFTYEDTNIRSDNDLYALEFKIKLANLLNNFDSPNSPKDFGHCDLIIVWDETITNTQQQDWRVVNRTAAPTSDLGRASVPDWVDTVLKDANHNYRPLIIVKDWVTNL